MFRAMKVHRQEVSCRTQASCYNVMSRCKNGTAVTHQYMLCTEWGRYRAVEAALWL